MVTPCVFVVVGGHSPSQNIVQSSQKIRDIFVQLRITINLEAGPSGWIFPSCSTRPFVADSADEANTADVAYNNLDNFEEANEDSIVLSGGKFNVESACEIQSTYATTNRNVDADVQSKDVFDLPLKGKAFFDLLAIDLVSDIAFVPAFTDRQESQL
jgi:hypothetical protein